MLRECEICGRPIKTGRKYCWEHRHTVQAGKIREDKKTEELIYSGTEAFKNYYMDNYVYLGYNTS